MVSDKGLSHLTELEYNIAILLLLLLLLFSSRPGKGSGQAGGLLPGGQVALTQWHHSAAWHLEPKRHGARCLVFLTSTAFAAVRDCSPLIRAIRSFVGSGFMLAASRTLVIWSCAMPLHCWVGS